MSPPVSRGFHRRRPAGVLMVISRIRGMNCVDLSGLAALAGPAPR